jgi:hypothetical protein
MVGVVNQLSALIVDGQKAATTMLIRKAAELSIKHFIDPSGDSTTRQHRV